MGFPSGSNGKKSACSLRDLGSIPGLGRYPGEGKGNPLQYSGLENSMDCIAHGVTKSRTQLSDFYFQAPRKQRQKVPPTLMIVNWRDLYTIYMEKAQRDPCSCYRKFLIRFLKEVRSCGNKKKEWTVRKQEGP